MTRLDDIARIDEEANDTYALDIIHARTTGARDDWWTEEEFAILQRFFRKNTGGFDLTYDAIKQLVDAMIAEGRNLMQEHMNT